ncbi:mucin-5AC-like isoform X1 [Xyrauchen texanus]|uniref:mucin-5AC-like isoform X1 n=1 Tax=Xyrauchen texanus TaxID=154827 RepID=UPI0022425CFE|nr:mucin-5AC-like isoform X1 [Xyrauchen texanus]
MVHELLLDNMVSKEPNHLPTVRCHNSGNPDKTPITVTVRSVLLNRNSPDIESRLKRRRNRTQQVRFKDLEDDGESKDKNEKVRSKSPTEVPNWQKELTNGPSLVGSVCGDMEKTIGAVTAFLKRAPPHPLTPGPSRRCWVPTHPCSFTLPLPSLPCRSTAIQTSPSLQKPPSLSATQTRSHSLGGGWDDEDPSLELIAQFNYPSCRSLKSLVQPCTPTEQSRCQTTEDNLTASLSTLTAQLQPCSSAPQKQYRRRGRRKYLNRAASDPGKPKPPCTSPTKTSPTNKIHQESTQSKKAPSNSMADRTSLSDLVPPQYSPTPNLVHNMPSSVSSTQTEPSCDSKDQTVQDSTNAPFQTSLSNSTSVSPEIEAASCPSQMAPSPLPISQNSSTCPKENATVPIQCCPLLTVVSSASLSQTEHASFAQTPSERLCSTTAQVMSTVTTSSTHVQSYMSPTVTTCRCCMPAVQTMANRNTLPIPESHCFLDSQTDPTTPAQSKPYCQTLEEAILCSNNASQKEASCCQGVPAVASAIRKKTPTQPMTCSNAPHQPFYSVISPTQAIIPIQSTTPTPVQTTTMTSTHTLTPIQATPYREQDKPGSTTTFSSPIQHAPSHNIPTQTLPHSVTAFPPFPRGTPCAITPHIASQFKGPVLSAAHMCILDSQNVPVLICSPSTQPVPGKTTVQTLPHCNSNVQNPMSCNNPSQILQNFKTPTQTVPHSKSFPQNMSPILGLCEPVVYNSNPQKTVPPSANFRHSLIPYACPPQTALLYSNTGMSSSPPQAFCTQDRRDRREYMLPPPPPPPPPPYTPRKEGSSTPGQPSKPSVSKVENKNTEKTRGKTGVTKLNAEASTRHKGGETPPPIPPKTKARATVRPTCVSGRHAILGPESQSSANNLPAPAGMNPQASLVPAEGQADTLRQVQELLGGLMSGAKCKLDLAKAKEKLFGPNGPLYDIGTLQSQLHSLEGVLETSQNTIKVLLDVIQDLEKKEAERDGRHSYRTGQDIENCGTCRDCACIIYSVEHDFRLQEGQVTRVWKVPEQKESEQSSPQLVFPPQRQQDSPQALQTVKKSRRKCFWFL